MKRFFLIFSFFLTIFTVLKINADSHGEPVKIKARAAKTHIGEEAIVSGTVIEIFVSSQTTNVYLYLDGDIKNAQFAAVWPGTNNPPVQKLQDLIADSSISVSGKIITEKSLPEIVVNSWGQINQQTR